MKSVLPRSLVAALVLLACSRRPAVLPVVLDASHVREVGHGTTADADQAAPGNAGGAGDGGAITPGDAVPDDLAADSAADRAPEAPPGPEERCEEVCSYMIGLVFPFAFCEDLGGYEAKAYFCAPLGPNERCVPFCRRTLAASPRERCRAAWGPVMSCIQDARGYDQLVFRGPVRACKASLLEMSASCWVSDGGERQRAIWRSRRPAAYSFRLTQLGAEVMPLQRVEVTVRGEMVTSAVSGVISVDQLFGIIAACAAEPGQSAFTEYDEALGFPTTVSCLRPDDEALWGFTSVRTYNVTDLRALP